MKGIVDFHTHAFPDNLASRAIKAIEEKSGISAKMDGTVSCLMVSMDTCGIEKSVVCSIATKPSHFTSIFEWSKKIRSDRIIPLPSIHPDDPEAEERISMVKKEGFIGIKMHPYYQDFLLDEPRMFPLYEKVSLENLLLVMHTGFDFAFQKIRKADPEKVIRIVDMFPCLKIVLTHMGGWKDWDRVEELIAGKKLYMEISFSLEFLGKKKAREIILKHPEEYVLFGTDAPWISQKETLKLFRSLSLGGHLENLILRKNAMAFL